MAAVQKGAGGAGATRPAFKGVWRAASGSPFPEATASYLLALGSLVSFASPGAAPSIPDHFLVMLLADVKTHTHKTAPAPARQGKPATPACVSLNLSFFRQGP